MKSLEAKTVRELAVEINGAARIFEGLGIDYCCGGTMSLKEACAKSGVPLDEAVSSIKKIKAQPPAVTNWSGEGLANLAQHIVEKHHQFTRKETARLEALFAKVSAAHGARHPELEDMQAIFRGLSGELRSHMMKEEHILFPYIISMEQAFLKRQSVPRAMFGTVENPVRNMMKEHDLAGESLRALRQASQDYLIPADACASYRELYQSLQAFESDLHTHIHLENNILFPRALAMEAER